MFNYFHGQKNGRSSAYLMGALTTALFFFILVLNMAGIASILIGKRVLLSADKPTIWILNAVYLTLAYQFIFNVLKLNKLGDGDDNFFLVEPNISKKVWIIYISNFLLVFILPLLSKYYFKL